MFVIFLGERILQIKWVKQKYETFRSDAQHIETYWQKNLQSVLWFFRFAYLTFGGLILWNVSLCLGGYEISPNGTLELLLLEQPGIIISNIAFALGGFVVTAAAQLTMLSSVAYMLPSVEAPCMQTCRYCVDKAGKLILVCGVGSYMNHEVPFWQNTLPVDTCRRVLGKPLLESSIGFYIYENIKRHIDSGATDLNHLIDPTTGRLSDAKMKSHCKTTYRTFLLSQKDTSPGFILSHVAPENVVYTGVKNLLVDTGESFSSWAKKALSWKKAK